MATRAPNPYDVVSYTGYPFPQTHPNRLATLATLFGLTPAPVTNCSVLELGCGDGANLIPMALELPESCFVGIDLAVNPIARGHALATELGLQNLDLRVCDIMDVDDSLGEFDYIIAHGVYSWVPLPVRDKMLAVCQRHLASHGVVYISYNTYPGYHLRQMVREMIMFHVREVSDPDERVEQGLALLKFLLSRFPSDSKAQTELYGAVLTKELEWMLSCRQRAQIFHDHLEPVNTPVYFHQFISHTAQYGLQYLAEADFFEMQDYIYPAPVRELLNRFDTEYGVIKEQYLDFIKCRTFRQTLLCRQAVKVNRILSHRQLTAFYIESAAHPVSSPPQLAAKVVEEYRGPRGAVLRTDHPLAKAALLHLGEIWPRAVSWDDLLSEARARLGCATDGVGPVGDDDVAALAEILLAAYGSGLVQLHVEKPHFVMGISERPTASKLARLQASRCSTVTNLMHRSVDIEDELGLQLLRLLDGTRDRSALRDELIAFVAQIGTFARPDGTPIHDDQEIRTTVANAIEVNLEKVARLALLVQ